MPVPQFPEFRPIEINHKNTISTIFETIDPVISEFTFTNLFVWRHSYQFQVSLLDGTLLVLACPEHDSHFFMPPAGETITIQTLETMFSFMSKEGWLPEIRRFSRQLVEELDLWDNPQFKVTPNREDYDYVYRTRDLIELKGKKLRKKKNHLNYFLKHYDFVFEPLTTSTVNLCLKMQEEWCNLRNCSDHSMLTSEDFAVFEALHHWEDLNYEGGIILIDGKVEAFSLGERLNKVTAVVHFEKANPKIRGLYPAINRLCCKNLWSNYTYINREQDLGEEGLRQAKLSYNPCFLVEKYTITPR